MTVSSTTVTRYTETHIQGTAVLNHKQGADEVLFVAPRPESFKLGAEPQLGHKASFYPKECPVLADAFFNDMSAGRKTLKSLQGRDLTEMTEYMAKQAK